MVRLMPYRGWVNQGIQFHCLGIKIRVFNPNIQTCLLCIHTPHHLKTFLKQIKITKKIYQWVNFIKKKNKLKHYRWVFGKILALVYESFDITILYSLLFYSILFLIYLLLYFFNFFQYLM